MQLQPFQNSLGWHWTLTQEVEALNSEKWFIPPRLQSEKPIVTTATEIVAHSNDVFETKQQALENAKYTALGILDALASRAISDS